jgi:hypothetical protein
LTVPAIWRTKPVKPAPGALPSKCMSIKLKDQQPTFVSLRCTEVVLRKSRMVGRTQQSPASLGRPMFQFAQADEGKTCLNPKLQTSRIVSGDNALS